MDFKTLRDFDLKDKTILMRADLNVPKQDNVVTDTARIDRLKPTIDYLRENGAKILILSHFGRPDGAHKPQMSLAFLTSILKKQWNAPVTFSQHCIGEHAQDAAQNTKSGEITLLENVRFHPEEKKNDPAFAAELAKLADIYVNDSFSVSHRAHASTEGLAHLLPCAAGMLMEEELNALNSALEAPEKPVLAVAGGSKISTKLDVLTNLIEKVDYLVLGGGMANTFLYAQGHNLGKSLCEKDMADTARDIMKKAESIGCEIILPRDVVTVTDLKENAEHKTVSVTKIDENAMAIDVGPQSIAYITEKVNASKTVVWNGPLGVFEIKPFDNGTNEIAKAVAKTSTISVAGGGDTVAALDNAGVIKNFSYISTAGGAFLQWLEGKDLPGVAALTKSQ